MHLPTLTLIYCQSSEAYIAC